MWENILHSCQAGDSQPGPAAWDFSSWQADASWVHRCVSTLASRGILVEDAGCELLLVHACIMPASSESSVAALAAAAVGSWDKSSTVRGTCSRVMTSIAVLN